MGNQSDVAVCSSLSCQKPGKHHCSGCRTAAYCSPTCQKSHWKVHKKTCAGAKKYNCFIIRATPIDPTKENPTDADYIEPFPLDSYGNWGAEMDELKKKRQWGGVLEPGKLYSHRPVNRWHYHAYQQYEKTDPPINPVASRCYRREINGDVAVVRSSDVRVNDYPEEFSKTELVRTTEYYKVSRPGEADKRARAAIADTMGIPAAMFEQMAPEGFPYFENPMAREPWMPSDPIDPLDSVD